MNKLNLKSDPMSRIPIEMKELLKNNNVMFDSHCHVFNYETVPDKFLKTSFPFTVRFLKNAEFFLDKFIFYSNKDTLSNIAYFINIFRNRTIFDIAKKMFEYYPVDKSIFVPLMMDMKQGIKGNQKKKYYPDQMDDIKELRDKYPAKILPFVAIDPNNPDVVRIFNEAFSEKYNFFGVKLYPSLGYLPSNPKLMEIFEICEEYRIPIVTHCNGGTVRSSYNPIYNIQGKIIIDLVDLPEKIEPAQFNQILDKITNENDKELLSSSYKYDRRKNKHVFNKKYKDKEENIIEILKSTGIELLDFSEKKYFFGNKSYSDYFNHPEKWEPVLKTFPKLKINFAHFGGDDELVKILKNKRDTWCHRIMDMMSRYDNVYADVSFNIYNTKIYDIFRKILEENEFILNKILYGSDYYMVVKKGHFRKIKTDFIIKMGDKIMKKIAYENSRRFLFE